MNAPLLRRTLAAALLAAVSLSAGCAVMAEGRLAPPVTGPDWVQAKGRTLAVPRKDRWTLIVVFRPGSLTCAEGMPDVLNMQKTYGRLGLEVVGVTAADKEDALAFTKENGIDFPVLADADDIIESYGIPAVDENYTYLVNPPGVVVAQCDLTAASRILEKYLRPQLAASR